MRELALKCIAALGLVAVGCGDSTGIDDAGDSGDSDTGSDPTTATSQQTTASTLDGTMSASADDSSSGTDTGPDTSATDTTDTDATTTGMTSDTDATTTGMTSDTDATTTGMTSDTDATTTGMMTSDTDATTTGMMTSDTDATTTGMMTSDTDATTTGMMTTDATTGMMTSDTDGTTGGEECQITQCGNQLYECGDCEDNDADGTIDAQDVECTSPCDDDEGSFATGIPGDNMDPCHQDCFFDGDSGSGNDHCNWNLACDPLSPGAPECPYDPDQPNCPGPQSQQCLDNCPVPPGCDCFGCCTVEVDGMVYDIQLGEDCDFDDIENCPSCTPNASCGEQCDPTDCVLCFGEDMLPPECEEPVCPGGQQVCEQNADCPVDYYCQTGCCELIPV